MTRMKTAAPLIALTVGLVASACSSDTPPAAPTTTPTTAAPTSASSPSPTTTPGASRSSAQDRPAGAPEGIPDDVQKATVSRIVDGDTLELAAVAAGSVLASTSTVDVRLLEIDTPETKHPSEPVQCYGKQATAGLRKLAPAGSTVWVQRDQELKDQYGRYLLYLWNQSGTFVNLSMVSSGYASAKLYQPNDKHWPTISQAKTQARSAGTGLWGACDSFGAPVDTPEPTPAPQPPPDDGGAYLFPPPPPDKDCGSVSANNFKVRPGDPHRFDSDGDGIGCES